MTSTTKIHVDTSAAGAALNEIMAAMESVSANPPSLLPMLPRAYVQAVGAMLVARSFGKRKHRRGWAAL